MSTVEQIHHLETRVDRLLVTLRKLRTAHDSLRAQLAASEERAAELESRLAVSENARQEADRRGDGLEQRLSHLQAEHEEIEATIARTLDQLGRLDIGAAGEPAGETPGDDGADAPVADEAAIAVADQVQAGSEAEAETVVDDGDQQYAADEPQADADNREGDELDIF
jgi:DNA repair exonuclease SbcCD ATPase subunit